MPELSVIVPVYNDQTHVEKCLGSILESTVKDIEVICVDDHSTDRSSEIIAGIAQQDVRVRVIRHTKNRGLSAARNTGIAAANGLYVGGVDSDDWINPDMFQKLLEASGGGEADIVECGFLYETDEGNLVSRWKPSLHRLPAEGQELDIFRATKSAFWNKIWKRALFVDNEIWFPEGVYYEDLATTPRLLARAGDIRAVTEGYPYHYIYREGSITLSASARSQMDYLKCFDVLAAFLTAEGLMDRYQDAFEETIRSNLSYHAGLVAASAMPEETKLQYLRHLLMIEQGYLQNHAKLGGMTSAHMIELLRGSTAG